MAEQKIKEAFDAEFGDPENRSVVAMKYFRAGYLALLNSPELEQCRKDAEWKAIETAPKDMAVLLYCFSHYEIGHFNTSLSAWACCWDHRKLTQPTHWKPLPKPPVTDAAIDKAMESQT